MDGQTGGRVDGWMDGWADEHTFNVPVEQYVSYQVYHILSLLSSVLGLADGRAGRKSGGNADWWTAWTGDVGKQVDGWMDILLLF